MEISAEAWRQLATVSMEAYQRIRTELDLIAARLLAAPPPAGAGQDEPTPPPPLVVAGYLVHYAVAVEERRVSLLEVIPAEATKG